MLVQASRRLCIVSPATHHDTEGISETIMIRPLLIDTAQSTSSTPRHLWDLEPSLRLAAESVTISRRIPATDPQPDGGTAPKLSTRNLKVALWGPPEQLTLSFGKVDAWDRRHIANEPTLTLERGGFAVTAECVEGVVTHVEITARRDGTCQLMNP